MHLDRSLGRLRRLTSRPAANSVALLGVQANIPRAPRSRRAEAMQQERDLSAIPKALIAVLSNAACRPAQGSIRLGLGLGLRPSAPAPPAIAAGYAHQTRGASCAQGLRGPAPAVLL